jgi:ATP-dependent helicase/nuclease subunit B
MTGDKDHNLYNIPAGVSFTDTLARGLLQETKNNPETLSTYLILLPTRRACRSLQDAFLRQSEGKPVLLPQIKPFGDIDAEELLIGRQTAQEFDLPPAISSLEQKILLAQTISKLPNFSKNPAQDMALATALGQLMDQIYTEGLNLSDLPHIVDREAFANHWQITLDFLSILSEHWPKILEDRGCIDAADRRNRLMKSLNIHWQSSSPAHPIIAAGSTGSIPATAALLKTISNLPKGSIILPGLDTHLSDKAWSAIEEGHPQATLKNLLEHLEVSRDNIPAWPYTNISNETSITREKIFSHVMTPPSQTDQWTKIQLTENQQKEIQNNLSSITRYDCATPQDEAQIISLIMRETLEDKSKTAALITPDRNLARRVAVACKKWGIDVDDSGGISLNDSEIGQYLRLSAQAMIDGIKPLSFLSLLKHNYTAGAKFTDFRSTVRALDKQLLRGITPSSGFDSLQQLFQDKTNDPTCFQKPVLEILNLINHLHPIMQDGVDLFSANSNNFKTLLKTHLEVAEKLASSVDKNGEEILWCGEEGEAAANFFSELYAHADNIPPLNGQDYLSILEQFMASITVRPRYGTHPRLMILGQLEARLIQADRVILSGLNEGTWPPDPGHDPWMSRPMRENFGLPLPERSITLAAHDFVQGACGREVFLTRSMRVDDAPSVPARWLQRLDTFLSAVHINPEFIHDDIYQKYAEHLNKVKSVNPIERPAPTPPIESRPRQLSVTKIEKWLQDPYSLYAEKILKLRKLDPLEKQFDAAERGTLLHEIMDRFTKKYPKDIPENAQDDFLFIAQDLLKQNNYDSATMNFWKPRLKRLSNWVTDNEKNWRQHASLNVTEAKGEFIFTDNLDAPFTLTARADRIDNLHDGMAAIIDYKSGGTYSVTKMHSAELAQLPLEAIILEGNGFHQSGVPIKKVGSLIYWTLTGSKPAGKISALNDRAKIEESLEFAKSGLIQLIQEFDKVETAYMAIPRLDNAPRFNDYEHLERIKEWTALGEDGNDMGEAA